MKIVLDSAQGVGITGLVIYFIYLSYCCQRLFIFYQEQIDSMNVYNVKFLFLITVILWGSLDSVDYFGLGN